ncbi:hypothetical protein CHUAL_014093 [Chamberlinius hualienensis]
MAPKYKLTYFNSRGLAEFSRLIFAYAGVDYEDVRLERGPQWDEFKPKTPFGVIPILEFDGVVIGQSRAIARYLANAHGLTGKTPVESARCDFLVDTVFDLFPALGKWYMEQDPAKKAELMEEFANKTAISFLDGFKRELQSNGYLVGSGVTWADLALAHGLWTLSLLSPTILDNYPTLKTFSNNILSIPRIKAWLEKRPTTPT